jgi:hypothetical protein
LVSIDEKPPKKKGEKERISIALLHMHAKSVMGWTVSKHYKQKI